METPTEAPLRQDVPVGDEGAPTPGDDESGHAVAGAREPLAADGTSLTGLCSRLTKKSKVAVAAAATAVTVLGGWGTIRSEAIDPGLDAWENRQPHHDEKTINCLQTDMQLKAFENCLGVEVLVVPRTDISFNNVLLGKQGLFSERVYLLETVYVEAFVDDNQAVKAYAVTARDGEKGPQNIKILDSEINIGSTKISEVEIGLQELAIVNAVHARAYYEVSAPNNFSRERTMAVGMTSAGALPADYSWPDFPVDTTMVPLVLDAQLVNENYYTIDYYPASTGFINKSKVFTDRAVVNSVAMRLIHKGAVDI